jgi:signal transduction histidine kinase
MMENKRSINSLFWRLSAVFILLLLVFAGISFYIFSSSTVRHSAELNQQLNKDLASHTVNEISKYINDGELNQEGMGDIMHSMMVINPSVEVYVLNNEGDILSYVAPKKVVKLKKVALAPIQKFIAHKDEAGIIEGDDPRNPGKCRIFSAAPIMEDDVQTGYVYIVLAGQKFISATEQVLDSHIMGISLRTLATVLALSLLIGMLAFWFITKRLARIVNTMEKFKKGELNERLENSGGREFGLIAETFNGMADSLQQNIEDLKGVDKLRKELIANVSHDLRTPIASIQGYAETLEMKQGKLDSETEKEYLGTIVKNSKKLNLLVEGLFELSKLESGQMDIRPIPFSISELVHDVAAKYRVISQKKGISINTILEKASPQVIGDISLIDRVLQNLIDNAIKFCKDGDTVNIELDISDLDHVSVRISDSGEGIPKEHLDQIFNRYFKGRSESNPNGTGLGLSIAQKIVHLHGGEISVKSQLNVGSTFVFTLPKAA